MQVIDRVAELSIALERARARGHRVGLVPTMGALHAGHRLLVRRATQECDLVVVTIFVNPLQFGDPHDLRQYPRSIQDDLVMCQHEGVAYVFAPPVDEMYPNGVGSVRTSVSVQRLATAWEGASRPGHFDGVTTVVAKLLAMTGRCRTYFGEKDFQQLVVVRQMVTDLSFPAEVVACPTVRDPDGVALSSRNARLSRDQRPAATVLYRALQAGSELVAGGEHDPQKVNAAMADLVVAEPRSTLDYAAVVDPSDLSAPVALDPGQDWRLLVAATIGAVRLIDNIGARTPERSGAPGSENPRSGLATAQKGAC